MKKKHRKSKALTSKENCKILYFGKRKCCHRSIALQSWEIGNIMSTYEMYNQRCIYDSDHYEMPFSGGQSATIQNQRQKTRGNAICGVNLFF